MQLARQLRDAGLWWQPADGDRFFVPDRDLDSQVFSISEMTVDVRQVPGGRMIAFNGTSEWALDSIMQREAVWLPAEGQLRELLGAAFLSLEHRDGGYRCLTAAGGGRQVFEHADAAESYGLALLHQLQSEPRDPVPAPPELT